MTAIAIQEETVVKKEVPKVFIAEILDGVPLYYRGYKEIIDEPSRAESVMGSSSIHFILLDYFYLLVADHLDRKKYWRASGESGIKIAQNVRFNLDLAIFLRESLPKQSVSKHFVTIAPELVLEIDTSIELDAFTEDEYVFSKTQQLLNFGTKKMIWVFSATNRVMIAEPNAPWQVHPWNTTLELIDGITFNIETFCRENDLDNLLNP